MPYGNPRAKLFGAGIVANADALAAKLYGPGNYVKVVFAPTWMEALAPWADGAAPLLLGAGLLLLMLEFRSSGKGWRGIIGLALLLVFFAGQYAASISGFWPVLLFLVGMMLFALELLVFSGSMLCAILGLVGGLSSLVWAMLDVWPGEEFGGVTFSLLGEALLKVGLAVLIAFAGFLLLRRYFPRAVLAGAGVEAGGAGEAVVPGEPKD